MSWAKLDDRRDDCSELNDLSADAVALFLRAQARMARLQTDGILTARDLDVLDQSRPPIERERAPWPAIVAALMGRGLLVAERDHWDDPGWFERNPSREEIAAAREYDAARQRTRYARSNGASEERLAELKGEEDEAKRVLFLARDRRQSAAVSQRRSLRNLTTETSLTTENPVQPHNAHPIPSRPQDEDEDEVGGNGARLVKPAPAADEDRIECSDFYYGHQSQHRLTVDGWRCGSCFERRRREEMATAIREAPEP